MLVAQALSDGLTVVARDASMVSRADIAIGGADQRLERRRVESVAWPELHVSHSLALSFQQSRGIGQGGAVKESNIDVSLEDTHIGKWGIANARGSEAVMHELPNIGATASHASKPWLRKGAKLARLRCKPGRNCGIAFDRSIESQECRHDTNVSPSIGCYGPPCVAVS